jgi:hypothetical protein
VGEPRRDHWGRYLLPDPVTGEERAWTRATTLAKTLSDPWGLVDWKLRVAVKGVAMREDLRMLAMMLPVDTGKKQLNDVVEKAIDTAGGNVGRILGDAMHRATAELDSGGEPEVLPPYDRDLEAYRAALALHGVRIIPGLVERIVCIPELGVAGTFDRIVVWDPHAYIADLKTGADLSYGWLEIAVQLALYANAEWIWNEGAGEWESAQPVDKTQGLVMHLPVGQARCDLYWVDLEIGWEAVTLAVDVREWRKRKDISRPFGVDLLGRSPVQPVLDLAGETERARGADSSATGSAGKGRDVGAVSPVEDSPAAAGAIETEGAGVTAARGAPVPAGELEPDDPGPIGTVRV